MDVLATGDSKNSRPFCEGPGGSAEYPEGSMTQKSLSSRTLTVTSRSKVLVRRREHLLHGLIHLL